MADVVNLRQARKQKARAEKEQAAAENRAVHGRTKAEKQRHKIETGRAADFVEGHRLDRSDRAKP